MGIHQYHFQEFIFNIPQTSNKPAFFGFCADLFLVIVWFSIF